jgi:hypothetical protein
MPFRNVKRWSGKFSAAASRAAWLIATLDDAQRNVPIPQLNPERQVARYVVEVRVRQLAQCVYAEVSLRGGGP